MLVEIIERGVAPLSRDEMFDQSALSGLTRAGDDDRRHNPDALGKGGSD